MQIEPLVRLTDLGGGTPMFDPAGWSAKNTMDAPLSATVSGHVYVRTTDSGDRSAAYDDQ